jgi:RHS repeat-associated protein
VDNGGPSHSAALHRRRFNGAFTDGTGLRFYGARYFDRVSLAWTQPDPLYRIATDLAKSEPRRANLYSFSLNNPLKFIDPTGLDSFGMDQFSSHGLTNSVAGAAARDEQYFRPEGGTWTNGLRDLIGLGLAHKKAKEIRVTDGGNWTIAGDHSGLDPYMAGGDGTHHIYMSGVDPPAHLDRNVAMVLAAGTAAVIGFFQPELVALGLGVGEGVALEGGGGAEEAAAEIESGGTETWEIVDGVRRAKAADIYNVAYDGPTVVRAEIYNSGGKIIDVAINSLLSPNKSVIDTTGAGLSRWMSVLSQTLSGGKLPPIVIQQGSRGIPISDVEVE